MKIPFTIDQFLNVFENYNVSIWPMQFVLYLFAFLSIYLLFRRNKNSDRIISMILTLFWLWMGIVYHLLFFTSINKGAYIFGSLYVIQSVLFLILGVLKYNLTFKYRTDLYGIVGSLFLLFALIIYPILGHFFGHIYPKTPTFGAPCPTTIFTFGILLMARNKVPIYLLIIPLFWSLIGFSAAVNLHIREDFGLFAAGLVGTILIIIKGINIKSQGSER